MHSNMNKMKELTNVFLKQSNEKYACKYHLSVFIFSVVENVKLINLMNDTMMEVTWSGSSEALLVTCLCQEKAGGQCADGDNSTPIQVNGTEFTCMNLTPGKVFSFWL